MKRFLALVSVLLLMAGIPLSATANSDASPAAANLKYQPKVDALMNALAEISPLICGKEMGVMYHGDSRELRWQEIGGDATFLCKLSTNYFDITQITVSGNTPTAAANALRPILIALQMTEGMAQETAEACAEQVLNGTVIPMMHVAPVQTNLWGATLIATRNDKLYQLTLDFSGLQKAAAAAEIIFPAYADSFNAALGLPEVIRTADDLIPIPLDELQAMLEPELEQRTVTTDSVNGIHTVQVTQPIHDKSGRSSTTLHTITVTLVLDEKKRTVTMESDAADVQIAYFDPMTLQNGAAFSWPDYDDVPLTLRQRTSVSIHGTGTLCGVDVKLRMPYSVLYTADGTSVRMRVITDMSFFFRDEPVWITHGTEYQLPLSGKRVVTFSLDEQGELLPHYITIGAISDPQVTFYLTDALSDFVPHAGYCEIAVPLPSGDSMVLYLTNNSLSATMWPDDFNDPNDPHALHSAMGWDAAFAVWYDSDTLNLYTTNLYPGSDPWDYVLNVDWQE